MNSHKYDIIPLTIDTKTQKTFFFGNNLGGKIKDPFLSQKTKTQQNNKKYI